MPPKGIGAGGAIGRGTLGAAAFVALAVVGIWRAGDPGECPATLPYEPASYRPAGEPTDELFRYAQKKIDKAVTKGVLKPNTAARKKSRLAARLRTLQSA